MIKSVGNMGLDEANEMNIPVCILLCEPSESETAWELNAGNYMPRKNYVAEGEYRYHADTKEELIAIVNKYIIPIYEAALTQLKRSGRLYYWEITEEGP